jgi:hypothetical protein
MLINGIPVYTFSRRHGVLLLFRKLVMHFVHINRVNLLPSILGHVVKVVDTSRRGITVGRVVNRAFAQVNGFFVCQVGTVVIVQDTVGVGRATADGKVLAVEACTIVVDVVELRASLVPPGNHGAHGKTVSTVRTHDVCEQLGGCGHGDSTTVAQFVQTAFHAQISFPKGTISGSSRHGSQEKGIDFNDLLDSLRGNVVSHGGTRIDTHNNTSVILERQGGSTLGELDSLVLVAGSTCRGKVVAAVERRLKTLIVEHYTQEEEIN